eukprot:CAMPEP_0172207508 /NCGR_PEP_ID=MMETSP1050-20130122/33876_1 /TAXON_ID=233186 /ORGANISM="Cryptomonas curvata, Strain CCAP979/52" /LENGTH=187 /DNA_ID=CAMNT_0012886837 /DNA_START=720 /DNA_END=1279 /DNA_ORIENTATION=-
MRDSGGIRQAQSVASHPASWLHRDTAPAPSLLCCRRSPQLPGIVFAAAAAAIIITAPGRMCWHPSGPPRARALAMLAEGYAESHCPPFEVRPIGLSAEQAAPPQPVGAAGRVRTHVTTDKGWRCAARSKRSLLLRPAYGQLSCAISQTCPIGAAGRDHWTRAHASSAAARCRAGYSPPHAAPPRRTP